MKIPAVFGYVVLFCLTTATPHLSQADEGRTLATSDAKELVKQAKNRRLSLNDVTELTPEAATVLATHGLNSSVAKPRFPDTLSPPLITRRPHPDFPYLGTAQDDLGLYLDGIPSLTSDVAMEVARHWGTLSLGGCTAIPTDVARILGEHHFGRLYLNGLTSITHDTARSLVQHKGLFVLYRLREQGVERYRGDEKVLSFGEAFELAQEDCGLIALDGLKELPVDVAGALNGFQDALSLNGLESLSPDAALALVQAKEFNIPSPPPKAQSQAAKSREMQSKAPIRFGVRGWLYLNGLKTLSKDTASILKRHEGWIYLNGLKSLTPEVANELFSTDSKAIFVLNGLPEITPELASRFSFRARVLCDGSSLSELSVSSAEALAESQWSGVLRLSGLADLPAEVANAIAQQRGKLYLDGLTTISADAAKSLSMHRGSIMSRTGRSNGLLSLNGLTSISEEVAQALQSHQGTLRLNGLKSLSKGAAKHLVRHSGDLELRGLEPSMDEDAYRIIRQYRLTHRRVLGPSSVQPSKVFVPTWFSKNEADSDVPKRAVVK